jgi:hypothetical protein
LNPYFQFPFPILEQIMTSNKNAGKRPASCPEDRAGDAIYGLVECPFCADGRGDLCVDAQRLPALADAYLDGVIPGLGGKGRRQVFKFGGERIFARPCAHLATVYGDCWRERSGAGDEEVEWSGSFNWDAPVAVPARETCDLDEFYLEVAFHDLDRRLRPKTACESVEFGTQCAPAIGGSQPARLFVVQGKAIFVENPRAFFEELVKLHDLYRAHYVRAIAKITETLNGRTSKTDVSLRAGKKRSKV